jgi:hypothetical protein
MMTTFAFAVVPSCGMYGSGDIVRVARATNSLETARKIAKKFTTEHRNGMARFGGTSGGYRVVSLGAGRDHTWLGRELDRTPDAR